MEKEAAAAWYRKPMWLGVVGLALMVGGWKLTTFVPPSSGEGMLAELRRLAPDDEYAEKVDRYATGARREPPYRVPGRLAVLAGALMFVAGVVGMYQARPLVPSADESTHSEDEDDRLR